MRTLVIGVGSTIRGDDGVGPSLAVRVCRGGGEGFEPLAFGGSGLDLLTELSGGEWERVVVLDSLDSGQLAEGEVARLDVQDLAERPGPRKGVSSHHTGLLEAFGLARGLGLLLPSRLIVYVVGVRPAAEWREGLSPMLHQRADAIVAEILADLQAERAAP